MPLTNRRKINGYLKFNLFNGWNRPLTEQLEKFGTCPALQVETFFLIEEKKFIQKAVKFLNEVYIFFLGLAAHCTVHRHIFQHGLEFDLGVIGYKSQIRLVLSLIETPGTELLCFIRRRLTNFKGTVRKNLKVG